MSTVFTATGTYPDEFLRHLDDDTEVPRGPVLVSLRRFLDDSTLFDRKDVGVLLEPEDDARALLPNLARLAHVEASFPVFGDGRGYTHARRLREAGYRRPIRASGDLGPDQVPTLFMAGFDAALLREGADLDDARAALSRYAHRYRGVVTEAVPFASPPTSRAA